MIGSFARFLFRVLFTFFIVIVMLAWLQRFLVTANSPLDGFYALLILVGILVFIPMAIAPKFTGQVLTNIFSNLVYDLLKWGTRLAFRGSVQFVNLLKWSVKLTFIGFVQVVKLLKK